MNYIVALVYESLIKNTVAQLRAVQGDDSASKSIFGCIHQELFSMRLVFRGGDQRVGHRARQRTKASVLFRGGTSKND